MAFLQHTLANGLHIIGEPSPSARSLALGFFVKTGSRDEAGDVSGVTHFLEHMVFKGTPRRSALEVNSDFDRIGANYNAYTSEENTVFYAAILPEYLPQAVDILADILRPSLRQEDFDMEKEVIIEEIGMYEDQPMWSAYDRAKQLYFADHSLGNSILGTPESIRAMKQTQMREYFQRRYVPSNITVAVAGHLDWDRLVNLVEKNCGGWEKGEAPRTGIRETAGSGKRQVVVKETVTQEHVVIMSPGPGVESPLIYAANLLSMVYGDDSGSRLYWELVDPGLADSAEASFHEYEGTGVLYTMFSCEPDQSESNIEIIRDLLDKLHKDGITEEELRQAKNKAMARLVRGSERPMGRMQAIGHIWTHLKTYRTVDEELERIEKVTLVDIRQVLDLYPPPKITTLALGPLEKLNGEFS